jgi:peptidoglycan/xylan/chitin deacetylase (PgdA/CDA1 family)
MSHGILVISLDFELMWGFFDMPHKELFCTTVLNARLTIPKILKLFTAYDIHATWATVGFLFFRTKKELLKALPEKKPEYQNSRFSPYEYLNKIGENEDTDKLHFGASLIEKIQTTPDQEIGTHTFSHYYCLEKGSDPISFKADLETALQAGERIGLRLKSLVFPKNQLNPLYLPILKELGIKTFRGNAPSKIYAPAPARLYNTLPKKVLRFLDAYINLTGHNTFQLREKHDTLNIPRSRFLRPYNSKLKWFEPIRLSRIKKEMLSAAKTGRVYHLCLHPHNFGKDMNKNLHFLEEILRYFSGLKDELGMTSFNMIEYYHHSKSNENICS